MALPLLALLGTAGGFAKDLMDRFWPPKATEEEKLKAVTGITAAIEQREQGIIQAQKEIMVAEMNQGDAYTKRARPTLVYAGLCFIFLVHVFIPLITWIAVISGKIIPTDAPALTLPHEFWYAWTGVVGIWSLGRSAERRGANNRLIEAITGTKK